MALSKVNYVDNQTIITAQNLNDIQNEIIKNTNAIDEIAPRNLLDNSDFLNPVNQRGETSWNANGYTIDRWMIYSEDTDKRTVSLSDSGLTCGYSGVVRQIIPSNVVDYDLSTAAYTIIEWLAPGLKLVRHEGIYKNDNGNYVVTLDKGTFTHVALYEGIYENNTPEYQPKGYAAELLECQRYFYAIPSSVAVSYPGYIYSTTQARITIQTPTVMRAVPSISVGAMGNLNLYDSKSNTVTGVSVIGRNGNGISLKCNGKYSTANVTAVLRFNTVVYLNANL